MTNENYNDNNLNNNSYLCYIVGMLRSKQKVPNLVPIATHWDGHSCHPICCMKKLWSGEAEFLKITQLRGGRVEFPNLCT